MTLRAHLAAIAILPGLALSALILSGVRLALPEFGRDYVLRLVLPPASARADGWPIHGPTDPARPLVVIDPGHGGRDPGAVSAGYREKDITLALALALRDALVDQGIRVALTREKDIALPLSQRPAIAQKLGADLFISLHADSAQGYAERSGASIYTLSARASNEAARRLAERENEADRHGGLESDGASEAVSAILLDLAQRRSQAESREVQSLILREGQGHIRFVEQPLRSAGFVVLATPDMPSVLYEAGFVTSPNDAQRLLSEQGRRQIADVIARAVHIHFLRSRGAIAPASPTDEAASDAG